jgi:hypothetical protein
MDVDHAELVRVAASAAGVALASCQVLVLLSLELGLSGLLLEYLEGLPLSDREQLGGCAGGILLSFGDLGGLIQRDIPWRKASLRSSELRRILPVVTVSLARPSEVPVTQASSETLSSLRASAATPKAASRWART